jgi:hypothetical protein
MLRHKVMPEARKSSAKMPHIPRPPPKNGSRPQSAVIYPARNARDILGKKMISSG